MTMLSTKQLKKVVEVSVDGKLHLIENAISGENDYVKKDCKVTEWNPKGWDYVRVWKPYTHDAVFSSWRVCFQIKYKGCHHYAWFEAHQPYDEGGEIKWWFDQIWNGGIGKKMRRDGANNIIDKLIDKAGVKWY